MKVTSMTKEQFDEVPCRESFDSEVQQFHSLVIIPTGKLHDSGFQIMDFVAVAKDGTPFLKISGCSDVLLEKVQTVLQFCDREAVEIMANALNHIMEVW